MSTADPLGDYLASLPPELAVLYEHPLEDALDLGDGRSVAVEELFSVLSEQLVGPAASHSLRDDRRGAGMLAGAWRHATFGQARAVLALRQVGLLVEAQANARGCIEHAVLLRRMALAADDGQLEPLMEDIVYQAQQRGGRQLNYLEELDMASGGIHRTLLQATRAHLEPGRVPPDKKRPQTRTIKGVFEAVPQGQHLYEIYGRLSEQTHAGLTSAIPYLEPRTNVVRNEPLPVVWAETGALLCWSCWAAEDAMLRFLDDGTARATRQAALLNRIGLAPG